jgi:hypothetical protein
MQFNMSNELCNLMRGWVHITVEDVMICQPCDTYDAHKLINLLIDVGAIRRRLLAFEVTDEFKVWLVKRESTFLNTQGR